MWTFFLGTETAPMFIVKENRYISGKILSSLFAEKKLKT